MEVKDPEETCTFEYDDFVLFVLQTNIRLLGMQPSVFLFRMLHLGVKLVEELIAEKFVVGEVELTACVPEGIFVSGTREIEPFGMSEFVAFEIEIAFSSESMSQESDHLVERHAMFDDGSHCGKGRHVGVHFCVAKMHHD